MVWRYSSSATVAWSDAMEAILVRRRPAAAESLHALGGERHERACGGREMGVAAGDERERVDHRRVERHVVQPPGEPAPERDAAGADGVAEPTGGEVERGLDVLDLDLGLERHARALGAVRELAARRVAPAVARVVEDQR